MISHRFTTATVTAILFAVGMTLISTNQGQDYDPKAELSQVVESYRKQRSAGLISLNESQIGQLRGLQAKLVKAGEIKAAKRLEGKIERLSQEVVTLRK